ncbi:MAG: serine hydrolase [Desulfuromusa sp.]|nr:serine hydrolase [Desulfuromusa sp.]
MDSLKYFLALFSLVFCGQIMAIEATRTLNDSGDLQLQQGLEEVVESLGLTNAIEAKQLALVLVIVTDPDKPRLAELNGRNMIYAASLPKIAILLGAAVAIDEGRLELNDELQTELDNMIRHSCNQCATRVLELVGRQELIEILQSPKYQFYDHTKTGGLWVGKDYGPGSAYQRDPVSGLSHGATAFQAARFYYMLQTGTLVSPQQTEMMLDVLSNSAIKHKFVKGLSAYPDLEIYRKSGTWKTYHADSALVRTEGLAYIMIALANNGNGAAWLEKLAAPLHELAVSHNKNKP